MDARYVSGLAFGALASAVVSALASRKSAMERRAKPRAAVDDIVVHPIKSSKGHHLKEWNIDSYGLVHDRRWMIVTSEGDFITQRSHPALVTLVAEVHNDTCPLVGHPAAARFSLPEASSGSPTLRIICSIDVDGTPAGSYHDAPLVTDQAATKKTVNIWDDEVAGVIDQGDAVASWLSSVLKTDGLRLVYMPANPSSPGTSSFRKLNPKWVPFATDPATPPPATGGAGSAPSGAPLVLNKVSFADSYNMLLLSRESVAELNRRTPVSISADNFRANIIVRSLTDDEAAAVGGVAGAVVPNEEDTWLSFRIQNPPSKAAAASSSTSSAAAESRTISLRGVKRCDRCTVTTVNPETGVKGGPTAEPLVTLRKYRAGATGSNAVFMGMNLVVDWASVDALPDRLRQIRVGDIVVVDREGPCGPY